MRNPRILLLCIVPFDLECVLSGFSCAKNKKSTMREMLLDRWLNAWPTAANKERNASGFPFSIFNTIHSKINYKILSKSHCGILQFSSGTTSQTLRLIDTFNTTKWFRSTFFRCVQCPQQMLLRIYWELILASHVHRPFLLYHCCMVRDTFSGATCLIYDSIVGQSWVHFQFPKKRRALGVSKSAPSGEVNRTGN